MDNDNVNKGAIIINLLEFLIKENLRLTVRVINLSSILSDKLEFSEKEEDLVLNPDINYNEERIIIDKLKSVKK